LPCVLSSCIKIAAAASGHHCRPSRRGRQRLLRRPLQHPLARVSGGGGAYKEGYMKTTISGGGGVHGRKNGAATIMTMNMTLTSRHRRHGQSVNQIKDKNGGERGRGSGQKQPWQWQQNRAATTTTTNMTPTTWHRWHGQIDNQLHRQWGSVQKRPQQWQQNGDATTMIMNMTPRTREQMRRPCLPLGNTPSSDAPHFLCHQRGGGPLPSAKVGECGRLE
jgi:hypothetical protein